MDDIPALVGEFFTASGTGKATADKFRDLLPVSIGFLLSVGVKLGDIPSDDQMKQLDEHLQTVPNRMGKSYKAKTIRDWKRITKELFTYRHNRKGDTHMTIPETTENTVIIPAEDSKATAEAVQTDTQPPEAPAQDIEEPEILEAETVRAGDIADTEEKRAPGRPIKGSEGRDKKITVNIPTSIFNDIKDMANIDNVTFPDCVNDILEQAVDDRRKDIDEIRSLRARRPKRH